MFYFLQNYRQKFHKAHYYF